MPNRLPWRHRLTAVPVRRILILAAAWAAAVGVAWGLVARPERCGAVTVQRVEAAATEAVGWFERNQLGDGRWTYGYDRDRDVVDRQPHDTRHSGVLLSLYQADAAGISGARELADRGVAWSLGQLAHDGDRSAVVTRDPAPTGATALLVAALAERRAATGDPRFDDELQAMGRFLVSITEPSGAVPAFWDPERRQSIPDVYSLFFTGETYFALASLETVDPGGGWRETADRIENYLATERDDAEDRFPPVSDHWAAYGLASTVLGGNGPLGDDERAYARRLGAIFGVQVRFESQRTGEGLNRWVLRGPQASGGGLATLGEGLGSLWRLAGEDDSLAADRPLLAERLRCVAGLLVDRQVDAEEAADASRPELAQGAWFRLGYTQKDQQQHALSALLQALPVADDDRTAGPSGDDAAGRVIWLLVIGAALVNPIRARRLPTRSASPGPPSSAGEQPDRPPGAGHDPMAGTGAGTQAPALAADAVTAHPVGTMTVTAAAGLGLVVLVVLAAVAGPLLRTIDVSAPTALIAAGIVVGLTALFDLLRPTAAALPAASGPGAAGAFVALVLVRPAVALLVLAVAADVGVGIGVGVAAAAALASLAALRPLTGQRSVWENLAVRAVAVVAIVGAVDLVVDGIFAI